MSVSSVLLFLFGSIFVLFSSPCESCVDITGIGDSASDIYTVANLSNVPVGRIRFLWRTMNQASILNPTAPSANIFSQMETPIQLRATAYIVIAWYNTLSSYDENAIEFWARQDVSDARRRCQPDPLDDDAIDLFELHRAVAFAYTQYYGFISIFNIDDGPKTALEEIGLIPDLCDNCETYGSCESCDDITTPWGLAYTAVNKEFKEKFIDVDGWNAEGNYNSEYNGVRYADNFRGDNNYIPVNNPWEIDDIERWQPLMEDDKIGYIVHQEHVVPHIGFTAKSFFFTDEEICDTTTDAPDYDYDVEMQLAIDRLANLDDEKKMLIERFDEKIVLSSFNNALNRQFFGDLVTTDSLYNVIQNVVNNVAVYESVLIVWKEKVIYDRIRPPSIIHELLADQTITSYAGTTIDGETLGTQTYLAKDWQPYIRTMPHSEYPSGSACICQAWRDAMIEWYETDNITTIADGAFPNGLSLNFAAFSSDYEPLSTPATALSFEFKTFSEISETCAQSRVDGGMHFTKSIESGATLCSNIGQRVAAALKKLLNGETYDGYIYDIEQENPSRVERDDCYRDVFGDDSDSDDSDSSDSD